MLSMEDKKEFLDAVYDANNDDTVLDDCFLEELAKHKARCQRDYAMKEGREEGVKIGKKEGFKQKIEQGSEKNKKEIIINMLNMNMDYKIISQITGKTIEAIKEIDDNIE